LEENNSGNKPFKRGPLYNLNPVWFIFLSLALVFFLYQILGGTLVYVIGGADAALEDTDIETSRLILSFGQFMFILVPTIILVMLQDNDLKGTFSLFPPKVSVLILSVIAILAIQPFLQSFVYVQNKLIFSLPVDRELINSIKEVFDTLEAMTLKLVQAYSPLEFILVVFVIALTPAICEEFLFRGLVFKNFQKVITAGKSIFFTGLFFALFHFHPFNLIPLIVLGCFLTYIVYHSGSIIPAVVCHFINNLIAIIAVYLYGSETIGTPEMTGMEELQYIGLGVLSLITFLMLVFLIKKYSVHSLKAKNLQ
jgi:membrane protease YdiL (CAAX protease family)